MKHSIWLTKSISLGGSCLLFSETYFSVGKYWAMRVTFGKYQSDCSNVFLPVMLLFRHSVVFSSLWLHELQTLQASLTFTLSQSLLRFMFIELVMPSKHLILCRPLLLLPSIFPSTRVFSSESALHIRWPKYWSFSFSISPSNEYSGLIFFRIDWFDLLVVQGTLKSLF